MNPLVGLIAGWLADKVIKAGGHGLKWDISLGLVGAIVGSWIFRALRVSPEAGEAGIAVLVVVALVAAATVIVAQRKGWPA